jgi:hypothetical protein
MRLVSLRPLGGLTWAGYEDNDDYTRGEEDENDFIRQNDTDDQVTTKWHPNTVKMCKMLRSQLSQRDAVTFSHVSQNSRRTKAANKFFEILQLKTWNFIEVKQVGPAASGPKYPTLCSRCLL